MQSVTSGSFGIGPVVFYANPVVFAVSFDDASDIAAIHIDLRKSYSVPARIVHDSARGVEPTVPTGAVVWSEEEAAVCLSKVSRTRFDCAVQVWEMNG